MRCQYIYGGIYSVDVRESYGLLIAPTQRVTGMAIISTSNDVTRRDDAAQSRDRPTTNRALLALERWIEMRTRLERARLDAIVERVRARPAELRPCEEWWRSWRASTRHRAPL
jgi:hypothetical protein